MIIYVCVYQMFGYMFWPNPPHCKVGKFDSTSAHFRPTSHPLLLFDVVKVQLPPLVPKDQASAGHWPDGFEKFGRKVKGNWRNWTENVVIIRFFYMKWLNGFALSWLKVNIWRAKHKWFPLKTTNFGWLEGPTFEKPLTSKLLWSFLET